MGEQGKGKRFRVPDFDVTLNDFEIRIVHTRQFQRLFYLRQLGLAYLVYPGATHTRGVHSLETLYQANRILDSLRERYKGESEKLGLTELNCRAIRLAALLHDIGHIPFSHTLEDEHCVLEKPHDGKQRVDDAFRILLKDLGEISPKEKEYLDEAVKILVAVSSKDDAVKDWRSDIVGNTICADLLAYVNTDSAWTGIEKRSGHYRIYDYFAVANRDHTRNDGTPAKRRGPVNGQDEPEAQQKPVNGQDEPATQRLCIQLTKNGVLRTDVVSAILDILGIRYTITERVLFHHAKCVASAMLARAARLCNLRDEDCHCLQEDKKKEKSMQRSLLRMGDEAFLDLLENRASEPGKQDGLRLVQQLRSRNLYKRIFKVSTRERDAKNDGAGDAFSERWRDRNTVEDTLASIEDNLGIPRGALVLWCSDPKAGKKLVRVNVVWESEDCKGALELRDERIKARFPTVHKRVKAVEEQYNDLWCLWVAIDPAHLEKAPQVIQALENRLGVSCDRMFREGHIRQKLNITTHKEKMGRDINETIIPIVHGTVELLAATAAQDGKDSQYTREDIVKALSVKFKEAEDSVTEQPKRKGSKKGLGQLEILSDGQRDDENS
jgi:HD superfamily phosphohydrolase